MGSELPKMGHVEAGDACRVVYFAAFALLAVSGFGQLREGWRLEPLNAFVHAGWWGLQQPSVPSRIEDWQPETSNGRAWSAYSQVMLDHANARQNPVEVVVVTGKAVTAVEAGLKFAPAQAAAWARLSLLRANQGDPVGSGQALRMSFRTGPETGSLAWLRSRLGLHLWLEMTKADKSLLAADIRRLWQQPASIKAPYPQDGLVRFAHGIQRLDAVREALPRGEHALLNERITSLLKETAGAS